MENKQRAFKAIDEINSILITVLDIIPVGNANTLIDQQKTKSEKFLKDPVKKLKRVSGIIKNYNENNAELKLKGLLNFLLGNKKTSK